MTYCKICGEFNCKEHTFLIGKILNLKEFSGSSPPEIFVGRYNYPNVNIGILSPQFYGENQILSSPEEWHKKQLKIPEILQLREQLIYGRTQNNIKKFDGKFLSTMQEVAMTQKSIPAEFKLLKPIFKNKQEDKRTPLIANAAFVEKVRLEENPKIKSKIDYIVNDTDAKSTISILELEKSKLNSSDIVKILSAGLLGLKTRRKLVPTRWAITAVDDTLSKEKLKKIKYYSEIDEFFVFHAEYLGNHYEFLLLPDKFSFEVIEISLGNNGVWKDYESFLGRKKYADDVTGAYYANRLALTEYLEKIKKQASCLVIREISQDYNVPLGVGILREASREAFQNIPEKFSSLQEAFLYIQNRLKQPITNYTNQSTILKEYGKQTKLNKWF